MRGRTLGRVALVGIILIGLFYLAASTRAAGSTLHQLSRIYQVIHYLKTESLYPVDNNSLVEGALRGIVKSTQDPYSAYLTPEEYNELNVRIRGSFGGLGIVIGKREGSLLILAPPYPGTPAEKAGLKQGDIISYIDDRDTQEMDADTAATLMRGEPGSRVVLKIKRNGYQDLIEVPIIRETINIPTVQSRILDQDPRIGYISLSSFSLNTGADLHKELAKVIGPGVKGLILDLRNNPGGELGAAIEVAAHFVPKGPVVRIVDRTGKEEVHGADGRQTVNLPLVVLVNEMSASASEIVAGAIKDRKAGILVGSKTYGKGLVQVIYPLKDGAGLKLTTSKYLTPEGNDIDQKGITPDIVVEQPAVSQQDLQLAKAVSVLQSQFKP
ncbi:MAG: S41 family peptidase [Syntrophomonadaceae bacterium]|nr:S41 family peptidase [Syntrophomonadaceae bacterium]